MNALLVIGRIAAAAKAADPIGPTTGAVRGVAIVHIATTPRVANMPPGTATAVRTGPKAVRGTPAASATGNTVALATGRRNRKRTGVPLRAATGLTVRPGAWRVSSLWATEVIVRAAVPRHRGATTAARRRGTPKANQIDATRRAGGEVALIPRGHYHSATISPRWAGSQRRRKPMCPRR